MRFVWGTFPSHQAKPPTMTRARSTAFHLMRLFDASPLAVYVIDDARRIVYCNPACAQWVGAPAESLIGERCDYHSAPGDNPAHDAACSLCPPPESLNGGVRNHA